MLNVPLHTKHLNDTLSNADVVLSKTLTVKYPATVFTCYVKCFKTYRYSHTTLMATHISCVYSTCCMKSYIYIFTHNLDTPTTHFQASCQLPLQSGK